MDNKLNTSANNSAEIIRSNSEFSTLFQRSKIAQWILVIAEIFFLIFVLLLTPIPVVGRSFVGVYSQFLWLILVPLLDVNTLIDLQHYRYKKAKFMFFTTLGMIFLGSIGFLLLGWANFCCTTEGSELQQHWTWSIWLVVLLFLYLPKIFGLYNLALLTNKIENQTSKKS